MKKKFANKKFSPCMVLVGLTLSTNDNVTASNQIQRLDIDANGNITVTWQKVFNDATDGTSAPDGPVNVGQLQAADSATVLAGLEGAATGGGPLTNEMLANATPVTAATAATASTEATS